MGTGFASDTPAIKKNLEVINRKSRWLLKLGYGYVRLPHTHLYFYVWEFSIIKSKNKKRENLKTCSKLSIKLALCIFISSFCHPHDMLCSRYTKTLGYLIKYTHNSLTHIL